MKLAPISSDQESFTQIEDGQESLGLNGYLPASFKQVFGEPDSIELFSEALKTTEYNLRDVDDLLNEFLKIFPLDMVKSNDIIQSNISKIFKSSRETLSYVGAIENADEVFDEISPGQAKLLPRHLEIRHYADGEIQIFNLLPKEVYLDDIIVSGRSRLNGPIIIPGFQLGDYEPYIIHSDIKGIRDEQIEVFTSFMQKIKEALSCRLLL